MQPRKQSHTQLMWSKCRCHCLPSAGTRSTVPVQCFVALSRTEVVCTATVAPLVDCLITFALSKVIERSPAWPAAKL